MLSAGWDVGGAHLKLAVAGAEGALLEVLQLPCPLWQGTDRLSAALEAAYARAGPLLEDAVHAVTMTGELADVFPDRPTGVRTLLALLEARLPAGRLRVYAGQAGLLEPAAAAARAGQVASANWLACAQAVGSVVQEAVLIDVGSTTSDLVRIEQGRPVHTGCSDAERLAAEELVYTGVVRTPVMAVAARAPYAGRWHALAAEHFATMADVWRLLGELPEDADLMPSADGRGKAPAESARRLARMVGEDAEAAPYEAWVELARYLAGAQQRRLFGALARLRSHAPARVPTVVAAGCGAFLARRLAAEAGLRQVGFGEALGIEPAWRERAATCAPAVALARLAR